jgi:hypothetical protein
MTRPRRSDCRARRVVLWAAGLFLLAECAGTVVLDRCWLGVRFPVAAAVLRTAEKEDHAHDIVTLGSSRFEAGIVAEEIGARLRQDTGSPRPIRVLNASISAGDAITSDFMMRLLLKSGAHPALAVIEVNPETVNQRNFWLEQHINRQLTWPEVPAYFGDVVVTGQLAHLLRARLLGPHLHREKIWHESYQALAHLFGGGCPVSPSTTATFGPDAYSRLDWDELLRLTPQPVPTERIRHFEAGIVHTRRLLRDYHIGGNPPAALERLIRRCRHHHIEVILVAVPVTTFHRNQYTPTINASFLAYMDRLTRTYHCRFFDYRDQVPDYLFRDIHHLTPEGGFYFSRRLTREVLSPAWKEHGRETLAAFP